MFYETQCDGCCRNYASYLRPKYAVLRTAILALAFSLFIGSLRGEKVSTLAQNITTTKDLYHKNDNFRSRRELYDEDGKNFENISVTNLNIENTEQRSNSLSNNHRKSVYERLLNSETPNNEPIIEFSSSWAVRLPPHLHDDGLKIVSNIADELSLRLHGNIGHLKGHYLLVHDAFYNHKYRVNETLNNIHRKVNEKLKYHPYVEWFEHEKVLQRKKRSLEFKDEFFPSQWHLDNLKFVGHDINVTGVWERNITGKGVTVSVIDDGVEWTNPDILDNYSSEGSWDLNSNDADPMPRLDDAGLNHHGTRCAGEIAAVANENCAVGVAFGAKVSGIRILDGPMTDSLEAMAFNTKSEINDIYSCSWGPDDNGRTVDGPHQLAQAALARGVLEGRKGFGSIFVVASGNGGHFKDNCNFDGYANSIFTVTIGAVDELGQMPYYAEQCAAMLAVTYSSGQGRQRNIVTTDWRLGSGTGCTDKHTGTSAAAPLAAGMFALMLEARSCLTWRDVQHIIVYTARRVDVEPDEWQVNSAGFSHSHKHGFGLLDSWALVTASRVWSSVPYLTSWKSRLMKPDEKIPSNGYNLTKKMHVHPKILREVTTLEHVTLTVSIQHHNRGSLIIQLVSPSGVVSRLASLRQYDKSREGFHDWTFSTVRYWGEEPHGEWKLLIQDESTNVNRHGTLVSWRITFYGSSLTPQEIRERKRLVQRASSGDVLDEEGPPCPLPPVTEIRKEVLSSRTLKIIALFGGFFFLTGVYFVLETLCGHGHANSEERQENKSLLVTPSKLDSNETQCTIDISSPEGMDSFVSTANLTKEDEQRLSNIIEFGTSRPTTPTFSATLSFMDSGSLEILNITNPVCTPDESVRIKEFEDRMHSALEESIKLQQVQMKHIDHLQRQCQNFFDEHTTSTAHEQPQKKKKKLKGILKKTKKY
ncbi:proprotein convertase subtilisin/kexin type 7-like [Clytia hemisphaerica]|uniref:P/Homo B domain-containing protein n=1 Tax=Clytia hemisphaerica TaxID=252671 RepID=A0A7M5X400_9CNID